MLVTCNTLNAMF